jgi:hypothetical protein
VNGWTAVLACMTFFVAGMIVSYAACRARILDARMDGWIEAAGAIDSIVGDWPDESHGHNPAADGAWLAQYLRETAMEEFL